MRLKINLKVNKKIIEKEIMRAVFISLLISTPAVLHAEDYPSGYSGPGYREYLSDKVQAGYYVETFTRIDLRQKERVNKRNQVEQILGFSSQAMPESTYNIATREAEHKNESAEIKTEIDQQRQERTQVASVQGEFYYIPFSDGKKEFFKDSLLSRTENERVVDEFGNVSLKNTWNMKYNNKRLLTSYEATVMDNLGNINKLDWYGVTYSEDSLFYGNHETKANKNLLEYFLKETDSAGNVKLTHFDGANFEGKLLRAFHQRIEDSVYGISDFNRSDINYENDNPLRPSSYREEGTGTDNLAYTLDRTDIKYADKDQLAGYREEICVTQLDGQKSKTTVDAQFKYLNVEHLFGPDVDPDPNRLLESTVTTTTGNLDGSFKTEANTTSYNYDANQKLTGASGYSEFNGLESRWFEYTDSVGHILSRNTDEDGNVTYSYVNLDTHEIIAVDESDVTANLKDGNSFSGTQEINFEVLFGKAMYSKIHSLSSYYKAGEGNPFKTEDSILTYDNGLENNLQRMLSSNELTKIAYPILDPDSDYIESRDITTTNFYDNKGNLIGAEGSGVGSGWEYTERGWCREYSSDITADYVIILGKALMENYNEDKNYK